MCVPPEYKLTVNDVTQGSRWQFYMRYLQLAVCNALRAQHRKYPAPDWIASQLVIALQTSVKLSNSSMMCHYYLKDKVTRT